jgi:hypothetical protein
MSESLPPVDMPEVTGEFSADMSAARARRKRTMIYVGGGVLLLAIVGVVLYFLLRGNLYGRIVMPYIAHQRPAIDPHLPAISSLADKLDEVEFDGLFNLVATPSGVVYEDGLGQYVGISSDNVVTVKLLPGKRWHDTYQVRMDDNKATLTKGPDHLFLARDLSFTLKRIQTLGSLSPDYILVSQAVNPMVFEGPDGDGQIRFQFRGDRIWKESDIKEILSFKILPDNSELNALNYLVGTGPYLRLPDNEGVVHFTHSPEGGAVIPELLLNPFVDNSTYTTELRNNNINVLLETPFGSLSPVLAKQEEFFVKSNISSTYFALLFNVERLSREQRHEARKLLNPRQLVDRFFRVGTPQQRNIVDYKGNRNNYYDYCNFSVFPASSYYVEEKIVEPQADDTPLNLALLPDTIHVVASVNHGFREELTELMEILNDPAVTKGKIVVRAVSNDEIRRGTYDAILYPVTGYRSNFLFDLYNIFLREPDLDAQRIHLLTEPDATGNLAVSPASMEADKNLFHLDARNNSAEHADNVELLQDIYGFMSTRMIGDKQEYAHRIHDLESRMALGAWMFSLPSLAYFSTQYDPGSIDLYGVASQLSTAKKWREAQR